MRVKPLKRTRLDSVQHPCVGLAPCFRVQCVRLGLQIAFYVLELLDGLIAELSGTPVYVFRERPVLFRDGEGIRPREQCEKPGDLDG